jgi:K+-transporting ATPase ATPase C chain
MLRRQLVTAAAMVAVLTVLCGVAYPLVVLGVGQAAFHHQANGGIREVDGHAVGSDLLGQSFTDPKYVQPRPSAAGEGYDAMASGASNLGPSNPALVADQVPRRVAAYRAANDLAPDTAVPVDAVTASASGLDPHVSVANARLQAPRVARVRHVTADRVLALVDRYTTGRSLGVLGEPGVDVLALNLALDRGEAQG